MEAFKKYKEPQQYAAESKEEIVRMLNSGKNIQEISRTFGINRTIATDARYNWKIKAETKVETKTIED